MNEEFYVYVCATDQSFIWLGISFGYKGFLQIVAMFMAFHTRRVKIRALNDSKETAAIIYINSVVIVMLAVSVFVLEGYHNVHATLFGLALLIQATLFIGILFIPKVGLIGFFLLLMLYFTVFLPVVCFKRLSAFTKTLKA